jgi:nudix-type nucleoside diphosphatase (YffH/AdpP family)
MRREAEEELGCRIRDVRLLFSAYMSPSSFTERVTFFSAFYGPGDRVAAGGGRLDEGEEIEVVELSAREALDAVAHGVIRDGKTIMLLQHLQLSGSLT